MKFLRLSLTAFLLLLLSCKTSLNKVDMRWAMDRNACSKMQGKVLLYAIFVDDKSAKPFTGFDIRSTMDSIRRAARWLEEEAKGSQVYLDFQCDYFNSKGLKKTVAKDTPNKTVAETLDKEDDSEASIKKMNRWADNVAKKAETSYREKADVDAKDKSNTMRKLIAKLKVRYKVDQVAILFVLNNYFRDDMSVTMNYMSDKEEEYLIVANKSATLITQGICSIFGGATLYKASQKNKRVKDYAFAKKEFPNDVMIAPDRDLSELELGALNRYLVGWENEIDPRYERLFYAVKPPKEKKK